MTFQKRPTHPQKLPSLPFKKTRVHRVTINKISCAQIIVEKISILKRLDDGYFCASQLFGLRKKLYGEPSKSNKEIMKLLREDGYGYKKGDLLGTRKSAFGTRASGVLVDTKTAMMLSRMLGVYKVIYMIFRDDLVLERLEDGSIFPERSQRVVSVVEKRRIEEELRDGERLNTYDPSGGRIRDFGGEDGSVGKFNDNDGSVRKLDDGRRDNKFSNFNNGIDHRKLETLDNYGNRRHYDNNGDDIGQAIENLDNENSIPHSDGYSNQSNHSKEHLIKHSKREESNHSKEHIIKHSKREESNHSNNSYDKKRDQNLHYSSSTKSRDSGRTNSKHRKKDKSIDRETCKRKRDDDVDFFDRQSNYSNSSNYTKYNQRDAKKRRLDQVQREKRYITQQYFEPISLLNSNHCIVAQKLIEIEAVRLRNKVLQCISKVKVDESNVPTSPNVSSDVSDFVDQIEFEYYLQKFPMAYDQVFPSLTVDCLNWTIYGGQYKFF